MRTILILLILAVAGCATAPLPDSDAKPVPSERILSPAYLTASPGAATVVFKRDSGMYGGACSIELFVDGSAVARLRPSERLPLHVPAGHHVFSAGGGAGLCATSLHNLPEIEATLSAGETRTYRIAISMSAGVALTPTAF